MKIYDIYNKIFFMKNLFEINEDEKNRILNLHENFKNKGILNEQDEDPNHEFIRAVQKFLNDKIKAGLVVDGLTDRNMKSKTAQAIAKFQQQMGVYPVDGVWGTDTWEKLSKEDKKKLEDLVAKEGGLISTFLNWIGL